MSFWRNQTPRFCQCILIYPSLEICLSSPNDVEKYSIPKNRDRHKMLNPISLHWEIKHLVVWSAGGSNSEQVSWRACYSTRTYGKGGIWENGDIDFKAREKCRRQISMNFLIRLRCQRRAFHQSFREDFAPWRGGWRPLHDFQVMTCSPSQISPTKSWLGWRNPLIMHPFSGTNCVILRTEWVNPILLRLDPWYF